MTTKLKSGAPGHCTPQVCACSEDSALGISCSFLVLITFKTGYRWQASCAVAKGSSASGTPHIRRPATFLIQQRESLSSTPKTVCRHVCRLQRPCPMQHPCPMPLCRLQRPCPMPFPLFPRPPCVPVFRASASLHGCVFRPPPATSAPPRARPPPPMANI
jgi:hypothetical protein